MAQATGYTYSQRGDVVLATRTGTTRNQPSSYKPFKLMKGVDTVITFFIRDVNGCPVQLHEKALKARVTKKDGESVIFTKNLRITDYENGVATLHIQPGDIAGLDLAFYNILITYTSADNKITALHVDQNYRHCYVAEVVTCGSNIPGPEEALIFDNDLTTGDWFLLSETTITADIEFEAIFGISFRGGLTAASSSLTLGIATGCKVELNVTISLTAGAGGGPGYSVVFVNIGIGYQIGDQIVVQGSQIGGVNGPTYGTGNDLVITVTAVNAQGGITGSTVAGTPNTTQRTYVSRKIPGPAFGSLCQGLNTFSIHSSRANGTINFQGTLNPEPGNDDYYDVRFPHICGGNTDIPITSPTGTATQPVTEAHAVDGMFLYIRFKMTITTGVVNKIMYRR
jgi:hypothetical protein